MTRRFDERLRAELAALEQSAPSAPQPAPEPPPSGWIGRAAVAGGVLVAGVVIGLLAAQLIPEADPPVAATPSPEDEVDEPSLTPEPAPTVAATPAPTREHEVIDEWTLVALDSEPGRSEVWTVIEATHGLLAVGSHDQSGAIWTSGDGLEWQRLSDIPQAPGDGSTVLVDVVSGPSGYVAVGWWRDTEGLARSSVIWTSADGVRWEEVATPADAVQLHAVAAVDDQFIAVGALVEDPLGGPAPAPGSGATVWRSPDGHSWQPAAVDDDAAVGAMFDIATFGDRLVAVGVRVLEPHPLDPPPGAWFSDDGGQNWMVAESPPGSREGSPGAMMRSLIAADQHLVAVGGGLYHGSTVQLAWVSADGATWELAFEADAELCCGLISRPVVTPAGIVAVGSAGEAPAIWRSEDGLGWEVATTVPLSHGSLTDVAVMADDRLVAVGNARTSALAGSRPTVAITELGALE